MQTGLMDVWRSYSSLDLGYSIDFIFLESMKV